jgi:hypothetical protein
MSHGVLANHSHCSARIWYTRRSLIERRKTEHKPNKIRWDLTSWRLVRSLSEFFGFSLVNNHSINSYQWPILIIRMSSLAERYDAARPDLHISIRAHIHMQSSTSHAMKSITMFPTIFFPLSPIKQFYHPEVPLTFGYKHSAKKQVVSHKDCSSIANCRTKTTAIVRGTSETIRGNSYFLHPYLLHDFSRNP